MQHSLQKELYTQSTMVPSCYWLLRYTALVFILYANTLGASSKCEILKASLRYTQEDAPTDLSGVVSRCVLVNCVERGMGVYHFSPSSFILVIPNTSCSDSFQLS